MGNKESKIAQPIHGGFMADTVPPSATLINDRRSHRAQLRQQQQQQQQQQQSAQQQQQAAAQQQSAQQQQQQPQERKLPVVIRYKGSDTKARLAEGHQLFIVTASGRRFPMSRSDDNYFAIIDLPSGDNVFRFATMDTNTFVDDSQPTALAGEGGMVVNIVNVSEVLLQTKDDDDAIDDATGWGQERTVFEETRKYPPMLPPHLRYTPLNAPPTQVRVSSDGSMVPLASDNASHLDAEHLPLPLSVTINHIYFQRREDHTITGITTRYRDKYTTVAYYRGAANTSAAQPCGSMPISTV